MESHALCDVLCELAIHCPDGHGLTAFDFVDGGLRIFAAPLAWQG